MTWDLGLRFFVSIFFTPFYDASSLGKEGRGITWDHQTCLNIS